MSLEAEKGLDTEFPDCDSITTRAMTSTTKKPTLPSTTLKKNRAARSKAKTLYYMFAFFLQKKLVGIDLTLNSWASVEPFMRN